MTRRTVPLPEGLDGLRVDLALSRMLGVSRTAAADLVDSGAVTVDGRRVARSERARAGAVVEVDLEDRSAPPPDQSSYDGPSLRPVFEDADLIVIDKPPGVAVHPSPGWDGPTVTAGLAVMGRQLAAAGAAERLGVVHRLDADTSGLMVLAKSGLAYSRLKEAFRERNVDKRYLALVQGHPDPTSGTIDAPIDRHPSHDARWAVVADGRPSVTHYQTREAFRSATLLDVRLETGRTHQIRVHMAATRHPCVGDLLYGADPVLAATLGVKRQWLHAHELAFDHPRHHREVRVSSEPPPDIAGAIEMLTGAA